MRRTALLAPLLALAAAPFVAHAAWPPGTEFDPGAALDITPSGFDALSEMLPAIVPPVIPVPGFNFSDSQVECFIFCVTIWAYEFDASNIEVRMDINDLEMEPKTGYLTLDADATISVNKQSDPIRLYAYGEAIEILSISQTCKGWVDPFSVQLGSDVYLDVVTLPNGDRVLDATIPQIYWNLGLNGNDLHLTDCLVGDIISAIQDVGGFVGLDPIGLIIDLLEDTIDDQIQGLIPELEATLEDAFDVASIEEEVEVGESVLTVAVEPSDVQIQPAGVRLSMAGSFDADPHPCVAEYGIAGSLETAGGLPAIGTSPAGIPSPHHIGALISDDFVNSGLFAAWESGLLCYTVTEAEGLPVNTTMLTLLSQEAFGELYPESAPLIIRTRPRLPPEAHAMGASDMTVEVRDLGTDFYAELDYRMSRAIGVGLETDVGVDFGFDAVAGELTIDIDFDPQDIEASITYNELAPGFDDDIEGSLSAILDTVVGGLLGDALADIAFLLPALEGYGLTNLDHAASGANLDFFGLYGRLGPVSYTGGGCEDGGGSCESSCTSVAAPARMLLVLLPLGFAVVRRRRG